MKYPSRCPETPINGEKHLHPGSRNSAERLKEKWQGQGEHTVGMISVVLQPPEHT